MPVVLSVYPLPDRSTCPVVTMRRHSMAAARQKLLMHHFFFYKWCRNLDLRNCSAIRYASPNRCWGSQQNTTSNRSSPIAFMVDFNRWFVIYYCVPQAECAAASAPTDGPPAPPATLAPLAPVNHSTSLPFLSKYYDLVKKNEKKKSPIHHAFIVLYIVIL